MAKKKKEDELLSGNYDGIEEYDNDLPRWWVWLFYLTIAYGIGYVGYFYFGPGEFATESLDREMKAEQVARAEQVAAAPSEAKEDLGVLVMDKARQEKGKVVYMTNCVACHGQKGEGLIGPNMTDDSWIHGGSPAEILNIINKGVIEKGMLPWEAQLSEAQRLDVLSFLWSIRNTNVAGPRPAEGTKVP